ncbi:MULTISPECIES: hypothetical protein [unclassified Oleiphilus]|nr:MULTISPECIES: hypothetical protein [unclassified Oleiphilus]
MATERDAYYLNEAKVRLTLSEWAFDLIASLSSFVIGHDAV